MGLAPWSSNSEVWGDICGYYPSDPNLLTGARCLPNPGSCAEYPGNIATCCAGIWAGYCGLGTDCGTPTITTTSTSASSTPSQAPIPNGWAVASACAIDDPSRVLNNDVTTLLSDNSPANCIMQCIGGGYQYAGVEYGDECHCGTGFSAASADPSECNLPCAGNGGYTCGGSWRIEIYVGPQEEEIFPDGWSQVDACAVDTPSRVLARDITTVLADNTPATCVTACASAGFQYAGVEYGNECHCGTGYANDQAPEEAPTSDCDIFSLSRRCRASMSNSAPDSRSAGVYEEDLISNYLLIAALTLFVYESLITFEHEIGIVWQRKWTPATWLFLANRYLMLASLVTQVAPPIGQMSQLYCSDVRKPSVATTILPYAFSALRVFALLDRAYFTAGAVLFLGLAPIGVGLFLDSQAVYYNVYDPLLGRSSCVPSSVMSTSTILYPAVNIAGRLAVLAADFIAIVATWIKTYRHVEHAALTGFNVDFSAVLLQYGTLFFVSLCLLELVTILLIPFSRVASSLGFVMIIPNILISRFLINLRQVDSTTTSQTVLSSRFSVLNSHASTASGMIGNLGQPLADSDQIWNNGFSCDTELREGCSNEVVNHEDIKDPARP
ncbi:hypothetical protein NM688_g925 [Phlebia brevispora]|uniref:Uncharacterized protein n=1 Tax=Phlebia brevispora TaxID=194682 RepID=A0ACC1TD66_9APHY|nr:hypothetical protein NM688_g925 [Phlebia brevispora]